MPLIQLPNAQPDQNGPLNPTAYVTAPFKYLLELKLCTFKREMMILLPPRKTCSPAVFPISVNG